MAGSNDDTCGSAVLRKNGAMTGVFPTAFQGGGSPAITRLRPATSCPAGKQTVATTVAKADTPFRIFVPFLIT